MARTTILGLFYALVVSENAIALVANSRYNRPRHFLCPLKPTAVVNTEVPTEVVRDRVDTTTQQQQVSPAEKERLKFQCDDSVEFWRTFQQERFEPTESNAREMANVASRFMALGPDAVDYWLRHTARSGYFVGNAVLGVLGDRLWQAWENGQSLTRGPLGVLDSSIVSRLMLEAALCFEQDYQRIQQGLYRKPWDMYYNARQASPVYALTQTGRFVQEALDTLQRRRSQSKAVVILDNDFPYPDYYQTAFHYQTNGWMSEQSANVYETSTETLFVGRQDAMQRTALPELVRHAREKKRVSNKPLKVLEVACGTGRFMTFCRDSLPLDTEYTAIDLSRYYLEVARDNDANWRRCRKRVEPRPVDMAPARILQAAAENLPFAEAEFDAVVCVYLFHELPRSVRAEVAAEAARVTKPGGLLLFTDSVQIGDRPILDDNLGNFKEMNEPYYEDYVADNLFAHFERAGLQCGKKIVSSTTKTLTFSKPK